MGKKIAYFSFEALFIGLCLWIVLQSTSLFISTTDRLQTIIDIENVKTFFEIYDEGKLQEYSYEILNKFLSMFDYIFSKDISFWEKIVDLLLKLLDFISDLIINFCNIGLNIVLVIAIILHEEFIKIVPDIKYTGPAKVYLKFHEWKKKILNKFKNYLIKFLKLLKKNKQRIVIHISLILLARGTLYRVLVELFIFLEVYIIRMINYELYLMWLRLINYLFVNLYPIVIKLPKFLLIIIVVSLIFISALNRAGYRLEKNHERLKKFAKEDITQTTFINGPPGSGKTLLNSSLTLASEENYIDELEDNMLNYEIKYPEYNFASVREKQTDDHQDYYKYYEIERFRKTYITSNYSIYSPYFMTYSKIFDFNNMRKNIKQDRYALEEYIVISISELDKEYNSHDNMKEVGQDGAATFYSTVSHDLKRHVKIFCDYQLKDQVPLRIRGNSEYFFTIESRKKKYPFLLYLYYLPFIGIDKLFKSFIKKYESSRKRINRRTERKSISKIKRNDYSLIYAMLRRWTYINSKICDFFDHYWYFKIKGDLSIKDGEKGDNKVLNLNLCDLEIDKHKLYDSTFLSYAYETKKNYEFKDLDSFTSLTPTVDELTKCNSRFYNKINGLDNSPEEATPDDDIIDL